MKNHGKDRKVGECGTFWHEARPMFHDAITISFSSLQFSSRKMATAKPEKTPDFFCGGTRVTG